MHRSVAGLISLACLLAAPLGAIDERKRIYIDRMSGFEAVLESAALEEDLQSMLIDTPIRPHYRISQGPRFKNENQRKFYFISTGRSDDMVLDFWDTRTKKTLVAYYFRMASDYKGQRRVARQFVREVRRHLDRTR